MDQQKSFEDIPVTPDVDAVLQQAADRLGLDPEQSLMASQWAQYWLETLQTYDTENGSLGAEDLMKAGDIAADALFPESSSRDNIDFRILTGAKEMMLALAERIVVGENVLEHLRVLRGNVIPDFKRIDEVLESLTAAKANQEFPYNLPSATTPQHWQHLPRSGEITKGSESFDPQKAAQFWFATCYYMRGTIDSNVATTHMASLFEDRPDIFDPTTASQMEPREIKYLLDTHKLSPHSEQTSGHWVENAKRLVEKFDGDPRNIFRDFDSYDELLKRVQNDHRGNGFIGFQEKMTSMLSYFFMDQELVPYQSVPLPVDFHVLRISISNELVKAELPEGQNEIDIKRTSDLLRKVYYDYASRNGITMLDLCDAVWIFSRVACSESPTNTLSQIGPDNGRSTVLKPLFNDWRDASQADVDAWLASCGRCPIRGTCKLNVPSKQYYIAGTILNNNVKVNPQIAHKEALFVHDEPITHKTESAVKHKLDTRHEEQVAVRAKRKLLIQRLVAPALFGLTPDQNIAIVNSRKLSKDPDDLSSLAPFSASEITSALGNSLTADESDALSPYSAGSNQQGLW